MVTRIEFGSREAANKIRDTAKFRGFLADSDDRRTATVVLKEGTPEPALNEITGEAADSKRHEADKAGQASLTDSERERIDFSREGMNVPKARSIKGVAQNEGVDDWMHESDFTLSVDENRSILKEAKQSGGGQRGGRDLDSDAEVSQRLAAAHHQRQQQETDRAKQFALVDTDKEAQEFLRGDSVGDTFDIEYTREDGRLRGQGEDFSRLEERHESRSERAQTMDEKRSAQITRDPIKWANNPGKYDYPASTPFNPKNCTRSGVSRLRRSTSAVRHRSQTVSNSGR